MADPKAYKAVIMITGEVEGGVGGTPEHPIYLPPSVWPPSGRPEHPIFMPPGIWPSPGFPSHPIVLPPDYPLFPTHPIPPFPSHPIVLPDDDFPPDESGKPPVVWPPIHGTPEHPIFIPPVPEYAYLMAWLPTVGWRYVRVETAALGDIPHPEPHR